MKDIIRRTIPAKLRRGALKVVKRLFEPRPPRMDDPDCYVGTDEVSGELQFELLKREGCLPESKVLEIGCGNLHGAVPLIRFLNKGNYVGVDPNEWLREAAMKKRRIRMLVERKCARFLSVEDFDVSELGISFDFVLSHSVLSHSAHWQLELFLRNAGKVLAPKGRILASIRLAEGNRFGSTGAPDREDSRAKEWQYPDITWFKLSTVMETARALGLEATYVEEYTEVYTERRPKEYHDWLVVHRQTAKPL